MPAIVAYELRYGLQRLPEAAAAPRLAALAQLLRPVQVLAFDAECAAQAASICCVLEAEGRKIGPHDTLIAATALRHHAPLVTCNVRAFPRVRGLQVVDWRS